MKINILDFTEYPGPRYQRQGASSGEEYYITVLNSAFAECYRRKENLEVNLDGTAGYPSSFLDEAFGELVYDFSLPIVKKLLLIKTDRYRRHEDMILNETFPQWEKKREMNDTVTRTMSHVTIFFLDRGQLKQKEI